MAWWRGDNFAGMDTGMVGKNVLNGGDDNGGRMIGLQNGIAGRLSTGERFHQLNTVLKNQKHVPSFPTMFGGLEEMDYK